jgi:MFS transporter, FSR family, fosmidomycin resistance protein
MKRLTSPQAAIAISAAGHFTLHFILGIYLVVVLVIQKSWPPDYNSLISLWTFGALLVGLGAPLAGWLGDRWGEVTMMIMFFVGIGAATVLGGLAKGTGTMLVALSLMGLFGSIYHPVGTSLALRNSVAKGKTMGLVGLFGGLGLAVSAPVAAALAEMDWRLAFFVPGLLALAAGLLVAMLKRRQVVVERQTDFAQREAEPSARTMIRAFYPLSLSMLLFSVIYAAFTTALPKWLSEELPSAEGGIIGIGVLVALIYCTGILAQLVGGWIADRWSAKWAYVGSFLGKFVLLTAAAYVSGWATVLLAAMVVFLFDVSSPAESVLVARFSPDGRRGLIFGIRQGAGLVAGPLGVQCVAYFHEAHHGFSAMMLVLAALALLVAAAGILVPRDRPGQLRLV